MTRLGSDWGLKSQEDLKTALSAVLGTFDEGDTLESKVEELRHYIRPPLEGSSDIVKRTYGDLQDLVAVAEAWLSRESGSK